MKTGAKKASTGRSRAHGALKKGDLVMVIAGGNKKKRPNKGKTGKIIRIIGERAVVEGLNFMTRNRRAMGPDKPAGQVTIEAPIHLSNLMFYSEKLKKPVRVKYSTLSDGTKVRGFQDPSTGKFVQIDG